MCGPHNFKGKPKLNKKEKISFYEVHLGWADWMPLSSGQKEYQSICTEKKLGRLLVTCGDIRVVEPRPRAAVKLRRST